MALLRDEDEAHDAMQQVFAQLVAHHQRVRGPVLHWLYRVTTNTCLKRIRQRKTHPVVADPVALEQLAAGGEQQAVDRLAVLALLGRLGRIERQVAVYYFVDRMTTEEVGAMIGRSRKTVERKLAVIRERAQAVLS